MFSDDMSFLVVRKHSRELITFHENMKRLSYDQLFCVHYVSCAHSFFLALCLLVRMHVQKSYVKNQIQCNLTRQREPKKRDHKFAILSKVSKMYAEKKSRIPFISNYFSVFAYIFFMLLFVLHADCGER